MRETYCLALGKPQNKGLDILQQIDEQRTLINKINTFSKFQGISLKRSDVTGRSGRGKGDACSTVGTGSPSWHLVSPAVGRGQVLLTALNCRNSLAQLTQLQSLPTRTLHLSRGFFFFFSFLAASYQLSFVGRKTPVTHHPWMTSLYVNSEAGFVKATPVFLDQL